MKKIMQTILGITPDHAAEMMERLTPRETEVANLMAQGLKNAKIAKQLGISTKTLDVHRTTLKKKLKTDTAVGVARVVIAKKLGDIV